MMGLFSSRTSRPPVPDELDSPDGREAHALFGAPPDGASRDVAFARLAALLPRLHLDAWVALGVLRKAADRSRVMSFGPVPERALAGGVLVFGVTDDLRHTALAWQPDGQAGVGWLWVDGRAIDLPRHADGAVATDGVGHWCSDRLYLCPVLPDDHPLQDWSDPFSRGMQFGVLVVDVAARRQWIEWPAADERWAVPWGRQEGDRLLLYADRPSREAGRVARAVPLDPA